MNIFLCWSMQLVKYNMQDPSSRQGFRVSGDVCFQEAVKVASAITPVPGGMGPVTISMLLSNTLDSAKRAFGMVWITNWLYFLHHITSSIINLIFAIPRISMPNSTPQNWLVKWGMTLIYILFLCLISNNHTICEACLPVAMLYKWISIITMPLLKSQIFFRGLTRVSAYVTVYLSSVLLRPNFYKICDIAWILHPPYRVFK